MTPDVAPAEPAPPTGDREAILRAQPWGTLLLQLTAIALKRIRGRSVEDAEDLAQAAIEAAHRSVASGGWDPAKAPLMNFLVAQVVGFANNERRRKRNRCEVWLDEEDEDEELNVHEKHLADGKPDPEEALGRLRFAATFDAKLTACLQGDELGTALLEPMREGVSKPADLAAAVGCSIGDVRAALRRLRYHAEAITKEMSAAAGAAGDPRGKQEVQ